MRLSTSPRRLSTVRCGQTGDDIAWLDPFRQDNRMGIEGTLHRISAMRDQHGVVNGLTCRIGRHIEGTTRSRFTLQHSTSCIAVAV